VVSEVGTCSVPIEETIEEGLTTAHNQPIKEGRLKRLSWAKSMMDNMGTSKMVQEDGSWDDYNGYEDQEDMSRMTKNIEKIS